VYQVGINTGTNPTYCIIIYNKETTTNFTATGYMSTNSTE